MDESTQTHTKESGQSLVELAISMTFLLILLAGIVDLGRAFFTYIALRDAAQEGASFGAVYRAHYDDAINCSAIDTRTRSTSSNPVDLSNTTDIAVDITVGGLACNGAGFANACFGNGIRVQVTYGNFPITMPFMGTILGTNVISLNAVVEDTILTPACQ